MIRQIANKVQDADLRSVLEQLIARSEQLERLKTTNQRKMIENRSRREGISVEKIERQIKRAVSPHELTSAERGEFDDFNRARLAQPLSDEELFCWVWIIVDMESWIWRTLLPRALPENVSLIQELVDFYDQNQTLLRRCGERHNWKIPSPFLNRKTRGNPKRK